MPWMAVKMMLSGLRAMKILQTQIYLLTLSLSMKMKQTYTLITNVVGNKNNTGTKCKKMITQNENIRNSNVIVDSSVYISQ